MLRLYTTTGDVRFGNASIITMASNITPAKNCAKDRWVISARGTNTNKVIFVSKLGRSLIASNSLFIG